MQSHSNFVLAFIYIYAISDFMVLYFSNEFDRTVEYYVSYARSILPAMSARLKAESSCNYTELSIYVSLTHSVVPGTQEVRFSYYIKCLVYTGSRASTSILVYILIS